MRLPSPRPAVLAVLLSAALVSARRVPVLGAQEADISPQERQILSNDLKEIAHMVAEMGDNRTRGNLVRRGDDLDRDLMTGEQEPHGAVDVMKWLAGYWSGTQDTEIEV